MFNLISFELSKLFRKWRTYIGFIAVIILVPVVQLALWYTGQNIIDMGMRGLSDTFYYEGNLLNGYLIGYMVLQALIIHIPFLIVLVGGDLLAGEATAGTYRMLLIRPVSRFKVITAKFLAGVIYTTLLLAFVAFVSLILSIIFFGTGELIVFEDIIYIFTANDVPWRFALTYTYAILSMSMVFALSFLFSAMVENAIGPIVATMAIIIVFAILSTIRIDALEAIHPYLFTSYMNDWRLFFRDPVDFGEVFKSVAVLAGHIVVFYSAALFIFLKKDILS